MTILSRGMMHAVCNIIQVNDAQHGFCPPPKIMGGLGNFFPFYLGGHLKFFLTLGGPTLVGGSLDMMGEYQCLDWKKIPYYTWM